ncbi:PTS transporter subunit EIIC [Thermoanaerobacterium sp. CMT5567-10]|uniref:PTS sugar transporter subunit IIC n=1 Tax=Thermoanaerobacterium sp. CMT5567-10 TaxID=3061989 RepID=UPI0026E04231
MEHLLESKFMVKLQDFGQKLGKNKFLTALQAAMMSLMGIIMVGAIFQILSSVGSESMLNLFSTKSKIYSILYLPYQFTMNSLSLWVVAILAYNYAKNLKMKSPIMNAVDALVSFLLVAGTLITNKQGITGIDMTYLGAQGMFVGFAVVFISVHIEKFCADKNIRIKMPDVVPPFLQDGFASIIPLLFSVIFFLSVSTIVSVATGGAYNVCSGFMKVLGIPLNALTSLPGMFILGIFAALLWTFGIHGTMIVISIILPLIIQAAASNAALHQAGKPLVFYPVTLFLTIAIAGGTGNTLPLVLMGLRSKSEQIKAVSKIGAVPGWFGINEPVTFGMPIMYNPILAIPYVLNIPVVMFCTYLGYKFGFLQPAWIPITALLPMGFGSYLSTLRWQNAIWDYLMLIPSAIVWYPFFKIYERQLVAKEKAAALEEAKYENMNS